MRRLTISTRAALAGALMVLALPVFASQASAALPLTPVPTFQTKVDENGADDQPGQKDLSLHGVATPTPGDLWAMWQWDDTSLSGGNTGDACALFDTNNNARVNFSLCVSIAGNPAAQQAGSPRIWTCNDTKVQTCPQSAQVTPINTACATNTNATDPFHNGKKDTQAICHIDLNDVGGGTTAKLVNTCSYPSQSPTSAPSDCVLIPRDAFVIIQKIASPNSGTFPFRLGTAAAASNPVVFTASGSQTSDPIAIISGTANNLKEDVPTNWAIDTPAPSCSGATSSNGTFSGDTISGINTGSDSTVTCVYRDKQQTGAIAITKQRTGTTVKLAGAHFQIDGAGPDLVTDANGSACVAGLSLGSHTVTETQAPNGHDLASPATQTVNVTTAGTCTAAAATATFNDALVLGTVNIHKTKADGSALAGATFTLFVNNSPTAGPRGAEDTITTLSCTTNAAGDCSIANVPPGSYWASETTTPGGYITASDKAVTVTVGGSPGTGDSESLTFVDQAAAGTINIHKTGLGGAALAGAQFTLYTDNAPIGGSLGLNDTATSTTCTTDNSGNCSMTAPPGDYWLVETVTPAGYDTADPTSVNVGIGGQAGQGATVNVPISDPVVNGTVVINKTGTGGVSLNGATFTLYVNNAPTTGTSPGVEDTITTKTCTTAGGTCSIASVAPGDYWVVETTTPNGYDTAAPQKVTVGVGATAHVGDTDTLSFLDPVVNGTVKITKTDDATTPNPVQGATFTLYVNNDPTTGPRGGEDTITTKTCTTAADGTCDITNVPPGSYWVVETTTPSGYITADDKAATVGIGSAAHVGDSVPVSLVDARRHRVVVLVCHEGTDTLQSRDVTVNGVTKQSLSGGALSATEQKALCDLGGASFGNIGSAADPKPDVNALVELSKVNGAAG